MNAAPPEGAARLAAICSRDFSSRSTRLGNRAYKARLRPRRQSGTNRYENSIHARRFGGACR
jgi:hypothetical protein